MRSLTVLLILLSAPGLASAQAGRFLLAVGDVAVARGQAEIRAATGMPVQSGDTIRVGPASNAQIRMTDESIVGLRPGTVFRIDAYEYSGQAEPRSIFSLLKGGFRTVTGAIGRLHSRERYAVRTPTATIGIRGTHYTVVHCDNDCGADRGSIANGTYGGVTDGRIEVVNQTGEHEFAANTFFYVASAGTAPQNLIAPPNFLYDRLEGQARSRGSQSNESSEALTRSGLNAESRPSEVPPPPQPSSFIVTEQKNSSGQPAVLAAAGALGFAGAWTSATGVANSVSAFVSNEMLTRAGSGTSQTLTAFNIPGAASGAATEHFHRHRAEKFQRPAGSHCSHVDAHAGIRRGLDIGDRRRKQRYRFCLRWNADQDRERNKPDADGIQHSRHGKRRRNRARADQ